MFAGVKRKKLEENLYKTKSYSLYLFELPLY